MDYIKIIDNLFSDNLMTRESSAEQIRDISENEYQYKKPDSSLTNHLISKLVDAVFLEKNESVQYQMLDSIYAWIWFPGSDEYIFRLKDNLENLLSLRNLGYALRILIATGNESFKDVYKKYLTHSDKYISEIALEGIEITPS